MGLNAYDRHKKFVNDYLLHYGSSEQKRKFLQPSLPSHFETEYDLIKKHHKFIHSDSEDESDGSKKDQNRQLQWEKKLAKRYYDRLFKEYCLADLSRYKEGKVALRWRTEKEVIEGKGQLECGNVPCMVKEELKSWEVNFAYMENGQRKNALVKLRLCPKCSYKLNYRKHKAAKKAEKELKKRKRREQKKLLKKRSKRKRKHKSGGDTDSGSESYSSDDNRDESLSLESSDDDHDDNTRNSRKGDKKKEKGKEKEVEEETVEEGEPRRREVEENMEERREPKGLDVWKQPVTIENEKTVEEEMDEYFSGLFG